MNVNLNLRGELETFINELVRRGMAANKTEAIRMAISRYYEEQQSARKEIGQEALEHSTVEAQWNNAADEKAAEFYLKRYTHGRKA